MKRAAIYARFSSDIQRDKSIDDQVALCREACARSGLAVVAVFQDRAISGASTQNRPGFQAMMRAAKARAFDVLIAEDVDRISRDQGDYHNARRDLDFLGIAIHAAQGAVSKIDGSLRALMSELFLENLADKTRRGLRGVLREGRHPGGRAYGYCTIDGKRGELAIAEAEAEIVREIFRRYARGETPRRIAADLNARKVPSPRGGKWNASTINGNRTRGSGMLFCEQYIGVIAWGRQRFVKDPATGKRVARGGEADKIVRVAAPHLRIIDDKTWNAARRIKDEKGKAKPTMHRRPQRLLSGLLKCGSCGGGMAVSSTDRKGVRVVCSAYRESGICSNGRRIYRDDIERKVIAGLRDLIADRACLAEYVRVYNDERRHLARGRDAERARLERRGGEIAREMARLIDAIAGGAAAAALTPRINALEAEREEVAAALASAEADGRVIALHPATIDQYKADLASLAEITASDADGRADVIAAIRRLIVAVVIRAEPGGGPVEIEIKGRLDELLGRHQFHKRSLSGGNGGSGDALRSIPPDNQTLFSLRLAG